MRYNYVMNRNKGAKYYRYPGTPATATIFVVILALLTPFNIFSASLSAPDEPVAAPAVPVPAVAVEIPAREVAEADSALIDYAAFPDSLRLGVPRNERVLVEGDSIVNEGDSTEVIPEGMVPVDNTGCAECAADSIAAAFDPDYVVREFNPDPKRAVWLSALFPGLGQLYNRRYWKLPLVVGGFMGLTYGMSWNNRMLTDYTQAYRDLMDNDPNTRSYMDFYPPNTDESQLNKSWLEKTFKARKDYFRRNRDLCIISMIGLYLVAMVDAYVDASLTHFDISPDLSVDFSPAVIPDARGARPGIGLLWAVNF